MGISVDAEAWLLANTFECEALGARLRPDQCQENRKRAKGMEFPGLLKACLGCTGVKESDMGKKTVAVCVDCKKTKEIQGKGRCGSCYHKFRKQAEAGQAAAETEQWTAPVTTSPAEQPASFAQVVEETLDQVADSLDVPCDSLLPPPSARKGVDALLNHPESHTMLLQLPDDVWEAMVEHEITPADVVDLLRDLVNLRLQRVAA